MNYLFGPLIDDAATIFRLWSPRAVSAAVLVDGRPPVAMTRAHNGFLTARVEHCGAGDHYMFRVGDLTFPDPASRCQRGDTKGWSEVTQRLPPSARKQPLRPWHETITCEVHIGTVTPEGTFAGLGNRLEHFRDAGYTALELMPINEFPGARNWGYDGTLIFAPDGAYGTRQELRGLVDRAHELGLCLILDVVYNHFGEVDNFIKRFAPEWFDPDVKTPWGPGIDFSRPMVRQFYYENACMWLEEFDFDGLRFDAVHEMKSEARDAFLGELAQSARSVKSHAKLIIENVDNVASWLERDSDNTPKDFTAQWNDDIHHVLNHLVTGEDKYGYEDAAKDPVADLEKALADGFVHDGEADGDSDGTTRGEPASRLPPDAFVSFMQNHDQIGNRVDGKRLPDRISAEKLDFLHFVMLMAPQIPLLFMGEEGHLESPFPFFVDLDEKHAAAKRAERYKQMHEIFNEPAEEGDLPDPNAVETLLSAKLPWDDFTDPKHTAALDRFREHIQNRRDLLWPLAATPWRQATSARQGSAIIVNWEFEAGTLTMALNPADAPVDIACSIMAPPVSTGEFCQHGEVLRLGGWSAVAWAVARAS